ncbi:MAG: alanine racemase [Lachnospiraceae bacterium]|nr:alanine racemase [Lachnospiraceae bacterium]
MSGRYDMLETPCYIFHEGRFLQRIKEIEQGLPGIPLVFSMKANPFLLSVLPEQIHRVEVCSPGELAICRRFHIEPERIIYSGVMKEQEDVREAVSYGAAVLTAESRGHFELITGVASELKKKVNLILRLSGGNQFGMSREDIFRIFEDSKPGRSETYVNLMGIHYYSGTAKTKKKAIERDLKALRELLADLKDRFGWLPELVEYGPGLGAYYFDPPYREKELALLSEVADSILDFAGQYPLNVEMGRFLAAPCGEYMTEVKDIKENGNVSYVIVDGGIHQVNYYGQALAMKIPPLQVIAGDREAKEEAEKTYCLCGSLCTTADVLVREISLKPLMTGDRLVFDRVGAYSVTEAPALFLSRSMPRIYLCHNDGQMSLIRDFIKTDEFVDRPI